MVLEEQVIAWVSQEVGLPCLAFLETRKPRLCKLPKVSPWFRGRPILAVLNCPGEAWHTLLEKLNNSQAYVTWNNSMEHVTNIADICATTC